MKIRRLFSKIIVIFSFLIVCLVIMVCANAGDELQPNFELEGVQYHLSAPDAITINLDILGQQEITLTDGEQTTIEWNYNVPQESLGTYAHEFEYYGDTMERTISVIITNELTMTYSREAYLSGQQFLTGELRQHIIVYEILAIIFPVYEPYTYDQVELVVSQLQAGNFASIENGSIAVSFPEPVRKIVNSLNSGLEPSYIAENYSKIQLVSEHVQTIALSPEFIAVIIEAIKNIPTVMPTLLPTNLPAATPMVTLYPESTAIPEVENIITQTEAAQRNISNPSSVEVVVSAVSAAVAVTAAGAASASAGAAGASAGLQQSIQVAASAGGAGSAAISFIKDIITGLRDMFMDEGRAHASGKMSENLKKIGKK